MASITPPTSKSNIPNEIWLRIVSYLPPSAVRNEYIGVNRFFFDYVMDRRYHTVRLKMSEGVLEKPEGLRRLVNLTPFGAKRTRRLVIDVSVLGKVEDALTVERAFTIQHHPSSRKRKPASSPLSPPSAWSSRIPTSLKLKPSSQTDDKNKGESSIYPRIEYIISLLSSIDHLEVHGDNNSKRLTNRELSALVPFFGFVWSVAGETVVKVSLDMSPEVFGYVLRGYCQCLPSPVGNLGLGMKRKDANATKTSSESTHRCLQELSIKFIVSFTFQTPDTPPSTSKFPSTPTPNHAYSSDSACIALILRLINSSRESLHMLRFLDWYGFSSFPLLLAQLDTLPNLQTTSIRTRIPRFAVIPPNTTLYATELKPTAEAITTFLMKHDATLRHLDLDLMEGWEAQDTVVCRDVLEPRLRLTGLRSLRLNPLTVYSRTPAAMTILRHLIGGTGMVVSPSSSGTQLETGLFHGSGKSNSELTRLAIVSYKFSATTLQTLLMKVADSLRKLVNLEVSVKGEVASQLIECFVEKLPLLESLELTVHAGTPAQSIDDLTHAILSQVPPPGHHRAEPMSIWHLQSIFVSFHNEPSPYPYGSSYDFTSSCLFMMAFCVAFPTVQEILPSLSSNPYGVAYDDILRGERYRYLRQKFEVELEAVAERESVGVVSQPTPTVVIRSTRYSKAADEAEGIKSGRGGEGRRRVREGRDYDGSPFFKSRA
ncbi:hypothetical protein ONZ45_g11854 [Pleurotus djamor]|nr:hypothetical protein ONZ45_g11854 [Pleurotus djamor]